MRKVKYSLYACRCKFKLCKSASCIKGSNIMPYILCTINILFSNFNVTSERKPRVSKIMFFLNEMNFIKHLCLFCHHSVHCKFVGSAFCALEIVNTRLLIFIDFLLIL
nr:hypothetical protein Iba_chr02bCG14160 [Ipomoea batatas]GMC64558.1 hypothetical protein Iba_chr02dCG6100 [Ipomoea batatas]